MKRALIILGCAVAGAVAMTALFAIVGVALFGVALLALHLGVPHESAMGVASLVLCALVGAAGAALMGFDETRGGWR